MSMPDATSQNETDNISDTELADTTDPHTENLKDEVNNTAEMDDMGCETQEAEINGVANLPEETKSTASKGQTKMTGKTRKQERPQKNPDASITEVDNMNDVGNLMDDSAENMMANLTDVALKQEVLAPLSCRNKTCPKMSKKVRNKNIQIMSKNENLI